jgi:hypothetical protein
VLTEPATTAVRRLVAGEPGEGGYRALVLAEGERHVVRDDLAANNPPQRWRIIGTQPRRVVLLADWPRS